ncbi:unnamed protein product [Rhizopus stolonifer]
MSALERQQQEILQLKRDIERREKLQNGQNLTRRDITVPTVFTTATTTINTSTTTTTTIDMPMTDPILPETIVIGSNIMVEPEEEEGMILSEDEKVTMPISGDDMVISEEEEEGLIRSEDEEEDMIISEEEEEEKEEKEQETMQVQPQILPVEPFIDPEMIAFQKRLDAIEKISEEKVLAMQENKKKADDIRLNLLQLRVKISILRNQGDPKRKSPKIQRQIHSPPSPRPYKRQRQQFQDSYPQAIPMRPATLFYRPMPHIDRPLSPPPPPPAHSPPPAPPPPPPVESYDIRESMQDSLAFSSVLSEIQQLVSFRISNISENYEKQNDRPLPNTPILTTLDDFTLLETMPFVNKNPYPDIAEDFIHIPTNNESPLFALLSRKAMSLTFNEPMETFANQILSRIPSDLDLLQQDMYFPIKMKFVYDFVKESPSNECQNALLTELNFLVHGQSEAICDVLCLDTWWQHVRFQEGAPPLEQIDYWLGQLAQKRKADLPAQAQRISQMNVEALVRTLLYDGGFDFVRKKLMLDEIKQDTVQLFSLDDTHVYLEERDKYTLWMIFLYFFVTRNLPDVICQGWMDGLVQTGEAKMEKDIFMIDWKPMLENKPFSKQGQIVCVNILLSMLNHFGNKTRNDMSRKPLLVGVLKTLFNFLSLSPSYKVAGALILARKVSTVASLQPEIQLIEIDLELRTSQSYNEEQLMETIKQEKNVRRRLLLGYHIVSRLPMKEKTELLKMAVVLGACVRRRVEVEDTIVLSVDKIRQTYLSILELDTLSMHKSTNNTRQMQSCSFAWLNLLVLLQISKLLYIENSVISDTLICQMDLVLNGARKYIQSKSDFTFIQNYVSKLKIT